MVNSVGPGCILTAPDIAIAACRVTHTHTHACWLMYLCLQEEGCEVRSTYRER